MSVKTYAQAIRDVLAEEMRKDENIFIMGEDVAEQGEYLDVQGDF
jgi:pyruvate dehydrogenase E1 component beta subunit